MTYQPVAPVSGVAGLRFLERTREAQQSAFDNSLQVARDVAAFRDRIAGIETAEQLVQDRQLLRVALGAFGLDEELGKTFFLRKILEEGTIDSDALANKLVDPRYREFSKAFGFGVPGGLRTGLPGFPAEIADAYRVRQFEIAVGNADSDLRLALGFKREVALLASNSGETDDRTLWLRVLGNKPLRTVFDTAFALPPQFATLDIDRQVEVYTERMQSALGFASPAGFTDPEAVDRFADRFLALAGTRSGPGANTPGSAALTLLRSIPALGPGASANLLLSRLG